MAYVPGFRYDLFISYATEDNVDGWVERFQKQVTGEVALLLGRPFSEKTVFLDKIRLEIGQAYPEILDDAARTSAVLLPLISPSYVTSSWCLREREAFRQHLVQGATYPECLAACRIRPTGSLPKILADAQRVDFVNPGGFEQPWRVGSATWLELVNTLALQIKHLLERLRSRAGAVFVGRPLNGHLALRDNLVDYLAQQSFRAIPEPALLEDRNACQKLVSESICSVHFLGQSAEQSQVCIEDSLQYCPGPTVLFRPFGVSLSAEEEYLLLNLPQDRYPHQLGPHETELKKFLEELLTRRPERPKTTASLGLVCDLSDIAWAQEFKAKDVSVDYPRFLQDRLSNQEQIQRWRELVRDAHGLLFYFGRSNERLLQTLYKLADQEKSTALRQWYLAEPDLQTKRKARVAEPVYPEGLEDFLKSVRARVQTIGASTGSVAEES